MFIFADYHLTDPMQLESLPAAIQNAILDRSAADGRTSGLQ